jgi:hypothetical protein
MYIDHFIVVCYSCPITIAEPERKAVTDSSTAGNPPAASAQKPPQHSADVLLDLMELGNGFEEVSCAL